MDYTGICCRSTRCIFYLAETGKGIKITSGRRVIVQTKPCERQARFGKEPALRNVGPDKDLTKTRQPTPNALWIVISLIVGTNNKELFVSLQISVYSVVANLSLFFLTQRSKLTFSKSRLLATFNCKMVAIKKHSVAKNQKTRRGGHLMTYYTKKREKGGHFITYYTKG